MQARENIRWTAAPVAMLWDMDNVLTRRQDVPGLARVLGDFGGPEVRRFAAGHTVTCRAHGTTASEVGFEVLDGGRRAQGADRRLLRRASKQAASGAQHFWVASNDGSFARVAHLGYLTVLTLDETRVSARLRAAAIAVICFKRSADVWRMCYSEGVDCSRRE
jgi:hypothetical protein